MRDICFCKNEGLFVCTANGLSEQLTCQFFQTASVHKRCLFLREDINNHCSCVEAQEFNGGIDDFIS